MCLPQNNHPLSGKAWLLDFQPRHRRPSQRQCHISSDQNLIREAMAHMAEMAVGPRDWDIMLPGLPGNIMECNND